MSTQRFSLDWPCKMYPSLQVFSIRPHKLEDLLYNFLNIIKFFVGMIIRVPLLFSLKLSGRLANAPASDRFRPVPQTAGKCKLV